MNDMEFSRRNVISNSDTIAFGCSHTWGVGVEETETWCYLLGARNFGQPSCSADFIARNLPQILNETSPKKLCILWPDWTRFEYVDNYNNIQQSLSTDKNRIKFMDTRNEEWLKRNFESNVTQVRKLCASSGIRLIDISLYNLISWIDHSDRWPISKLGHHYGPVWHAWVASIFKEIEDTGMIPTLAYE